MSFRNQAMPKNQAYLSNKPGFVVEKTDMEAELELQQLNADEISKLKEFLKSIQVGSCSIAQQGEQSGKSVLSSLIASKTNRNNMWILDSGATDHMSYDSNVFTTYKPLEIPKQIVIANGTSIPIKGQGHVTFNPNLFVKIVLHVPNLSTNLISVHQLTRDLNCRVIFSPHLCEFQDMAMGRMIGAVEEKHGPYVLKQELLQPVKFPTKSTCISQSSHLDIWLHHYHLGHPPFYLLKAMFPVLFKQSDPSVFHCDVCEFSKHHRVSYPISNKRSAHPFALVHLDVWGPSRTLNCSGARWFIFFIDDCNRMTWVSLLKDKATVSTVLPHFYSMIFTQFGSPIQKFRIDNARDYFN